jgi:hypothetical protein
MITMSDLEIEIKLGSFNVKLKGPSEDVKSQFAELKKNGFGEMVNQLLPLIPKNAEETNTNFSEQGNAQKTILLQADPADSSDEMSLQDVVFKMLPTSEKEWILIYGYFLEKDGHQRFTRNQLIEMYDKSGRKSAIRMKNLSGSITGAVKSNWLSAVNDKEFILTPSGRDQAKIILSRTEGTAKPVKKRHKNEKQEIEEENA